MTDIKTTVPLTEAEWRSRYAARMKEQLACTDLYAQELASLPDWPGSGDYGPEDAADDELSYWGD